MHFIDTNIFLRHLTNDDPAKARKCFELFQKAKVSQIKLTTSEAVIAEVVYLLSSKRVYNLNRQEIVARLRPLLSLPGLKLLHRNVFLRALEIYAMHSVDFEDALSKAHMEHQKITGIYSYDTDFDKFNTLKRIEP